MANINHGSIFIFVSLLIPQSSVAELLCHPFLTAVVQGAEQNGFLLTLNLKNYTRGYYEKFNSTHFRVCVCTQVPCLRKCCPLGQVFINTTCQNGDLDIKPPVFTNDLKPIPNYGIWNFHRVYGNTCKLNLFHLEPEEYPTDVYYLLSDGVLTLPYDGVTYDTSQFCFENVLSPNFAAPVSSILRAFICFPEIPVQPEELVYPIGMIISMPFLLATFIVYSLPELRNLHGKNLMSHVAALLAAYIVLVTVQLKGDVINDTLCIVCGFLIQYLFLATFLWLNVMCFDIWSTFSGFGKFSGKMREKEKKKFILYSVYAWGLPAVISIITMSMEYAPNVPEFFIRPTIGTTRCFFETKIATLVYFYAPMAAIVVCDITLFILTAIKICRVRKETKVLSGNESRRNDEANKQRYNLYLKLFMVMGINWVTELISWAFQGPKELWYLTDIMNSLQGIFIFWIFVCSRKIKKVLISRFCPQYASRETEMSTSSMKMSMSNTISDSSRQSATGSRRSGKPTRNGNF